VTVCVTTLFRWNYGTLSQPDMGIAAITASDRMISAGDVQYEPAQQKVAVITSRCLVLIAGDYSLHSQAIRDTMQQVQNNATISPYNISLIYGRAIQTINVRHAEDLYLAPLGLNSDTFLAQQNDMSREFVSSITTQMQAYIGEDVEALVVGSDGANVQLYHIDHKGTSSNFDDVGFAAIGIGSSHARSTLMQSRYVNAALLGEALAATYRAKKGAEVAPGVGEYTDMHVVLRDRLFPVWPNIFSRMDTLYDEYETQRQTLVAQNIRALEEAINEGGNKEQPEARGNEEQEGLPTEDAPDNEGAGANAAQAPRSDEGGEEPKAGND
jgi:20S proteasome alpha/beta subunit